MVAVCIHRCRSVKLQFFYRAMFVVPMVIPGLVVVLIWRSFFFEATSGYLNRVLVSTGLFDVLVRLDQWLHWGGIFVPGQMPAWLGDPRLILTSCVVWGFPWVGSFAVLTHLAKLQGISKDIYEAADIDGVNWWSKFTRIELPLIMGSIYLLLVFVIIDTIKDAGMVLALAGMHGGPGGKATVPALFMIRKAFTEQQMGYACAVGIVLTIIVMALQKLLTWFMRERQPRAAGVGRARPAPAAPADATALARAEARRRSRIERQHAPWRRAMRRMGGRVLRLNKHLFIWLVLAGVGSFGVRKGSGKVRQLERGDTEAA
jgi:ABC-type sugar transport system permease subunit